MYGFFKNFYYPTLLDCSTKQKEELGCSQEPSENVKEIRIKIQTSPQLPWLVHPPVKRCHTMSFSSLSEGKVFKSSLPCPDFRSLLSKLVSRTKQISYFLESSRGWLVMLEWELYFNLTREMVVYLVNPVSGAQHQLPPLQTILCYKEDSDDLIQVVLSNPDVSKTIVAAVISSRRLILCRPRDKSWSVFHILDEDDSQGCIYHLMFSNTGMLYVLVNGSRNCGAEAWIESRNLKFGDDEVKLKVIYDKEEWWIDQDLFIQEETSCRPYLSESTNNELLLIYQILGTDVDEDFMEENVDAEECNEYNEEDENDMEGNELNESVPGCVGQDSSEAIHLKSFFDNEKTRCFTVYKIDPDNNKFQRVQDIGDQILFLAEDNSSLSLLASNFKELRGNSIHFATRGSMYGTVHTSREIGIYYFDSGRIERSFPSFWMGEDSRLSWFMPNS